MTTSMYLSTPAWLTIIFSMFTFLGYCQHPRPTVGVCASAAQQEEAQRAGFDFMVPGVSPYLLAAADGNEIHALPVYACNVFLPAKAKCVGPEANAEALMAYADTVFRRAQQLNVPIIIFGSGAARRIPDGYSLNQATEQFVTLCRKLADRAATYGVKIALENLNSEETNFITTLEEARLICEQVNRPNFGINADIYHMLKEREPATQLQKAGKHIVHCDIAEPENRTPPGVEGTDFTAYLEALKAIGYQGGIGVEARWTDFPSQATTAYETLTRQLDAVYRTH